MWKILGPRLTLKLMRFWPPLFGTGIRVTNINKSVTSISVKMHLGFYNKNVVGVQFGGSLYTMCDPFYMCILMHHLGPEYIVWDKSAEIKFVKPGKTSVYAKFEISDNEIEKIRDLCKDGEKYQPTYKVQITDSNGELISIVTKTLYIRKKNTNS